MSPEAGMISPTNVQLLTDLDPDIQSSSLTASLQLQGSWKLPLGMDTKP